MHMVEGEGDGSKVPLVETTYERVMQMVKFQRENELFAVLNYAIVNY